MKDALAGVVSQVAGEHRIGDLHAGRRGGEAGAEDHPVALVPQVVRQRERLLGEPGQPVAQPPT